MKSEDEKKTIDPPCQQCFPGILHHNLEAWQVFQTALGEAWGVNPSTVISLCRVMNVSDEQECLYKVMIMSNELNRLEESRRRPSGR